MKRDWLAFRAEEDLKKKLQIIAHAEGRSVANLIRRWIEAKLAEKR